MGRSLADGREARVRSARPRDARRLAALIADVAGELPPTLLISPEESTARFWRRRIAAARTTGRALLLVAYVHGELAGTVGVDPEPHPNAAHVAWIGMSVDHAFRGLGVGSLLLETATRWAGAIGLEKLVLGVFPENVRALAFYERHGFGREGLRRAQFRRGGRYHDEILMARFLTPLR